MKKNYAIAAHVVYNQEGKDTYGPAHGIFDFLKKNHKSVVFIKHCLYGKRPSSAYDDKLLAESRSFGGNLVSRSFKEFFFNLRQTKEEMVFIGVDPLNGLAGAWMKLVKRKKFIYLTPDYTENRFKNKIINFIYHLIDRTCLKLCDEVWSVSSRIAAKRKSQGVPDRKNKLLPNSPAFADIPRRKYDGNKNLVIVSHLSRSLDLAPILEALSRLKGDFPDTKLLIVGSGPEERYFKDMVEKAHLGNCVDFLGQKNHDEVLDLVSRSFLGFALYTLENSWNYYGDSMKAREYAACGVPVIINDVPSTADDIRKYEAGLVLHEVNGEEIYSFVRTCLLDKNYYLKLRNNALNLGREFDKEKILYQFSHF